MSDDPFAEPGDTERTIIRPRPSGQAAPAAQARPASRAADHVSLATTGTSPLLAAAAPLLAAAVGIGNARSRPADPELLRRNMIEQVREFESKALATGLDTRSLRAARYALCATIDDLVLSTPWGAASSWTAQSLTSVFHQEVVGGERFFDILQQMERDLGRHADVVELMYICASLGFEGRYRVLPRGTAALTELRDSVYRTIRQRRGEFERELSVHWRGIAAGYRPLSQRIPLWAIGLGTLTLACLAYTFFALSLAGASDAAFTQVASLPPRGATVVPRPEARPRPPAPAAVAATPAAPAPPSSLVAKLRGFLEPEVRAGLVTLLEDAQSVTVRLANRNMFASGSGELNDASVPLLRRIGEALQDEPGDVIVNGFTDNQPIRTARFPSNFELSQARADAVTRVLRQTMTEAGRLQARGRADADPIAPNATPEGRQQNRRTEIVLVRIDRTS